MVIILISFLNPGAKERIIDQTIKQMTVEKNEDKIHIFTKVHTQHYVTAYKMFLDNKLFGVGVKNLDIFVMIKSIMMDTIHVLLILIIPMFKF